jgi:hypothetical protein
MKLLLFSAFCLFSAYAFTQQDNNNYPRLNPEILKKFKGNNDSLQKQLQNVFLRRGSENLLLNMHGNIAVLPQDNMPCVVPDVSSIAKMPNVWSGVAIPYIPQYHPIPNPALPKVQTFKWNVIDNSLNIPTK